MVPAPHRFRAPVVAALGALLASCGSPPSPPLVSLGDLGPRHLEVGDRLEITGRDFPSPTDLRRVSVTLRGTLARPGLPPCGGPVEVTITDPPAVSARERLLGVAADTTYARSTTRTIGLDGTGRLGFVVTEEILGQLSQCPGHSSRAFATAHATLRLGGDARGVADGVTVRFEGVTDGRAITGSLRGPSLELHAPAAARPALEAQALRAAERTLDALGITLATSHPSEGGLRVASVQADGAADRAGIASGDVLARIDGATVLTLADFRATPGARSAVVGVLRGDVFEEHTLALQGLTPRAPTDLVIAAVLLAALVMALVALLGPQPGVLVWLAGRVRAVRRHGPVGIPSFARWIRHCAQALIAGRNAGTAELEHAHLATLAPALTVAALASTIVLLPFGRALLDTRLDATTLYAGAALLRLAAFAIGTVSRPSAPGAGEGAWRYWLCRAPAVCAVACVIALAGTLRVADIVAAQGGWPWEWFALRAPFTLVLFALFVASVFGAADDHGGRAHGPQARAARVAVTLEWAGTAVVGAVAALVFLGGWQLPGCSRAELEQSAVLQMLAALVVAAKTWGFVLAALWTRWALPRIQLDALLAACWRYVLASFGLAAGATVAWVLLSPRMPPLLLWACALLTTAMLALGVFGLLARSWLGRLATAADVPHSPSPWATSDS